MTNGQFQDLVYKVGYHLRKAAQSADPSAEPAVIERVISQCIGEAVSDIKSIFDFELTKNDAETVWRTR